MNSSRFNMIASKGFSLVELAVVLVILGFVIGALMLPLQAQRENTFRLQTENQLETARKALIGFAQTKERLPCPATANGTGVFPDDSGVSNEDVNEVCAQQWGFLPAATLGIQPTDSAGFAIDGWGNRIFYAVTQAITPGGAATADFTTTGEMANVGIASLAPDLRVCRSGLPATGITTTTCSALPENNYLINNAVAVIYSTGATATLGAGGEDENENLNADAGVDTVFVSRGISGQTAPGGEFDHMVVWVSPYVLYNAMIQVGQLN
ncbi:MAG: prepilin-type cleavage/methylation domain-containing protein [Betaproteobacteria bacterium HGW-Betaproteobacteria-8]|nr:MAG: prepilin-type cleavage/methylation domain-containing protein [Betaproteobacteria bacterium HGW-Betaproteobacteria-8]